MENKRGKEEILGKWEILRSMAKIVEHGDRRKLLDAKPADL